jgi:hypothetical protein
MSETWPAPWTLKPVVGEPELLQDFDEHNNPLPDCAHWDIGFGFALNVADDENKDGSPLTIEAHFSDADLARGFCKREATPEQVEEFARLLLNIAAAHKRREAGR